MAPLFLVVVVVCHGDVTVTIIDGDIGKFVSQHLRYNCNCSKYFDDKKIWRKEHRKIAYNKTTIAQLVKGSVTNA